MKTFCKDADVESAAYNTPGVALAFTGGKLRRGDFRALLVGTGVTTEDEINAERRAHSCHKIVTATEALCQSYTGQIRARQIEFAGMRQFKRIDGIKRKERDLCQESAKQQVFEYILVHALGGLLRAKFLPCQYGSIPGRGQVAGKRAIERILRCKLTRGPLAAVQGDGHKAYPSTQTALVLGIIKKYCHKNAALIWLAEAVMANYPGGVLVIGGYFSTYAFNLVMSFLLRHAAEQGAVRRGHRVRYVLAMACYADDFILFGRLSQLVKAMKRATRWAADKLGIVIKGAWQIMRFDSFAAERAAKGTRRKPPAVDMMGYVVRRCYTVIRGSVFLRIRRQLLRARRELDARGFVPWWRAVKITSYNGWIKYTDSVRLCALYDVARIMTAARASAGRHYKMMMGGCTAW